MSMAVSICCYGSGLARRWQDGGRGGQVRGRDPNIRRDNVPTSSPWSPATATQISKSGVDLTIATFNIVISMFYNYGFVALYLKSLTDAPDGGCWCVEQGWMAWAGEW